MPRCAQVSPVFTASGATRPVPLRVEFRGTNRPGNRDGIVPTRKARPAWARRSELGRGTAPDASADFPVDANRRQLADAEAKKKGQAIVNAKVEPPGKGPPQSALDKKIDKKVDDLLDKAGKKARQLNKDTMPEFDDVFEELSPEAELAEDMAKGIENAKKQIEFIQKTIDYAEKFSDATALKALSVAAKNLKKVSEGVLAGLGKAAKVAALGKDVVVFFQALRDFADASDEMSASDGQSVAAWVGSLKSLWNASKPFVDKIKDEAFTAALAGSEAAGALGATMAIVGAELYVGIQLLDAGVKNVNAYFKRLNDATREGNDRVVVKPDSPQSPPPFQTRKETIASIKKHAGEEKQLAVLREKNKKEAAEQQTVEEAKEAFDTTEFPVLYLKRKYRQAIFAKVAEAWRKSQGRRDDVHAWWDCFIDDSPVDGDAPPDSDAEVVPEPPPRKVDIDARDAADEVRRFLDVSPTCPFFNVIHQGELKRYLTQAQATGG